MFDGVIYREARFGRSRNRAAAREPASLSAGGTGQLQQKPWCKWLVAIVPFVPPRRVCPVLSAFRIPETDALPQKAVQGRAQERRSPPVDRQTVSLTFKISKSKGLGPNTGRLYSFMPFCARGKFKRAETTVWDRCCHSGLPSATPAERTRMINRDRKSPNHWRMCLRNMKYSLLSFLFGISILQGAEEDAT